MQAAKQVREPAPEKLKVAEKVESLAKKWSVIVATNLDKVRAAQIMALRKNFRGQVDIYVPKNRLAVRGLKRTGLDRIDGFIDELKGQKALMFTDINPFKLNLIFESNKISLPARAGDTATDDIIVSSGNTGIPAGPVLGDFRGAGVPTKIDTGNIWVTKDSTVAKKGELVSSKLSGLLSRLGLRPIRAGISISTVYWNGLLLHGEDVSLNLDEYRTELTRASQEALSLALEASYPSTEALLFSIGKAGSEALNLAVKSGYAAKETIGNLLAAAQADALNLQRISEEKAE